MIRHMGITHNAGIRTPDGKKHSVQSYALPMGGVALDFNGFPLQRGCLLETGIDDARILIELLTLATDAAEREIK